MIASNHNRRFDFAALHQFVHGNAELGAFAVSEPANARRQSLKLNSFTGELHPASERLIFRKEFEREFVGAGNVVGIAAQRHPAKRTASFAKQRPNVFENESWNVERVFDS